MQYYFDIFTTAGDHSYVFKDNDILNYPEDLDFLDAVADVDVGSNIWPRLMQIRNMRPQLKVLVCVKQTYTRAYLLDIEIHVIFSN